jgi:hypothetical protein
LVQLGPKWTTIFALTQRLFFVPLTTMPLASYEQLAHNSFTTIDPKMTCADLLEPTHQHKERKRKGEENCPRRFLEEKAPSW